MESQSNRNLESCSKALHVLHLFMHPLRVGRLSDEKEDRDKFLSDEIRGSAA